MTLVVAHARAMTVELVRYPAYVVPTLLLPPVFFLFFVPRSDTGAAARMAAFAGFAAIGVAFFQFGVGIAAERASPWEAYLRTLPVSLSARFAARLLSAALFAAAAALLLVLVAVSITDAHLSPGRWVALAVALIVGTAPFGMLGIAVGYWAPAKAALPIANLLYLALSYAGGLWAAPGDLPHAVAGISGLLPTGALAGVLVASTHGQLYVRGWAELAAFTLIFALIAAAGYRRDEAQRFR